jgi:hypothetical protein
MAHSAKGPTVAFGFALGIFLKQRLRRRRSFQADPDVLDI